MQSVRILCLLTLATLAAFAQQVRVLGTVQSALGASLEVKTDQGEILKVTTTEKATVRKVAPGAKDLSAAQTVSLDDLASGDRVLLRGSRTGADFSAESIILMSSREIAQKNQAETAEWTRRGIAGVVESVNASAGTVTVTTRTAEGPKPVTVSTGAKTDIKRYAKDSVRYSAAEASQVSAIQKGDQLRALGEKSADGASITAEKIIYGTFRSAAGTITTLNADAKEIVIKDWQTGKPVTIHLTSESTVKKMPQFGAMGGMRGMRPGGGEGGPGGAPGEGAPARAPRPGGGAPGEGGPRGMGAGMGMRGGRPDLSAMIERFPAIALSDLAVGDTIMVSSIPTGKPDQLNAVLVVGGAENILAGLAAQQQQAGANGRSGAAGMGMGGGMGGGLDSIMGMAGVQ